MKDHVIDAAMSAALAVVTLVLMADIDGFSATGRVGFTAVMVAVSALLGLFWRATAAPLVLAVFAGVTVSDRLVGDQVGVLPSTVVVVGGGVLLVVLVARMVVLELLERRRS